MTDDKTVPNLQGYVTHDGQTVDLRKLSDRELTDIVNKTTCQNKQAIEEKEHQAAKQKEQDNVAYILEDACKDFRIWRETQLSERETAILRTHTDKEIADALKKHAPDFGPPGTITTMVTDAELENKALKAMTEIGFLHHTMAGSACCGKDGIEYNWDAIQVYCKGIIKATENLKEAAYTLRMNTA